MQYISDHKELVVPLKWMKFEGKEAKIGAKVKAMWPDDSHYYAGS